jgi:membrane-bound lytic murein transglycosylase D
MPFPHTLRGARALVFLAGALLCAPRSALAADPTSVAPSRPALDPEAPAAEEQEPSIWSYIEGAEGAPPAPSTVAATAELVEERRAELGSLGLGGALPSVEYYLDPVSATDGDPLHLDRVNPAEFDIPVVVNDEVIKWMRYFLGPGRKYYTRYLERSTRWIPLMHREIAARGLPKDLVYLSMIESGFSVGATSYASAAGLWQFMTYTGRDYGLRVDWWVDERRDPELATKAALEYLQDLSQMFAGDWWLAWASYNGGQGRVMKATRAAGTVDFWKIAAGEWLHTETDNYVPKLIAAAIIGKHPERYGFVGLKQQTEFVFDTVKVPASTSVEVLARCAGLTAEQFLEYNPALRRFALPPEPAQQSVRVPKGNAESFAAAFAKVPAEERLTLQRHVVRRGESLAGIAKKYGISVDELAKVNRIGNVNRISVGMELVVPVSGSAAAGAARASADTKAASSVEAKSSSSSESATASKSSASSEPSASKSAKASSESATVTHVVRSGDTLSGIAAKYGVSVKDLQSWNELSGSTILVGQKLTVKGAAAASASGSSATKSSTSSSKKPKTISYTVRRGDTLGAIAERYGCSISDLKSWNNLKGSTISVGQKLVIKE